LPYQKLRAGIDRKRILGSPQLILSIGLGEEMIYFHLILKIVEALLKDNSDLLDGKINPGFTPLHRAVQMDHKDLVEMLLTQKAKVNAKNNDGSTPLHYVAFNGHKDVTELLREHGGHV
jgi:ankyrin repeat protein